MFTSPEQLLRYRQVAITVHHLYLTNRRGSSTTEVWERLPHEFGMVDTAMALLNLTDERIINQVPFNGDDLWQPRDAVATKQAAVKFCGPCRSVGQYNVEAVADVFLARLQRSAFVCASCFLDYDCSIGAGKGQFIYLAGDLA